MIKIPSNERLIVALDVETVEKAQDLIEQLGDSISFYKIGMELVYAGGLDLVKTLSKEGKKVFLDLKLHDIPTTVERATARIADLGATFLTVHGFPQTMKAALLGKGKSNLNILAVTVMTSYDDKDLREAGYSCTVQELVRNRAAQALDAGIYGLILSPREVSDIRNVVGSKLELITPGIRPAGAEEGDQKRIMTPREAIKVGADRVVIGRPITAAVNPKVAAINILTEIEEAIS